MLNNEQIICIGLPTWEGEYMKSTVQLLTELAKNNDILYVDYPFTLKDLVTNSKAPTKRMLGIEKPLRKIELENGHQVSVLTLPPTLPINFIKQKQIYDTLLNMNAWQAKQAIRKAMRDLHFNDAAPSVERAHRLRRAIGDRRQPTEHQ